MKKPTMIALSVLGGFVFGKVSGYIFGGETARKAYTAVATSALLAKDSVMEGVEKIQSCTSDIMADARKNVEKHYEETGKTDKNLYDRGEEDVEVDDSADADTVSSEASAETA